METEPAAGRFPRLRREAPLGRLPVRKVLPAGGGERQKAETQPFTAADTALNGFSQAIRIDHFQKAIELDRGQAQALLGIPFDE